MNKQGAENLELDMPSGGLADLSIRRPVFITCIVTLMLAVGLLAMKRLGVDLFPEVNFPVIFVANSYSGAGPSEMETLITKPVEDEVSTLSGLKRVSSISQEGSSVVIAEFTLETDIKFAEQQVRDRVSGIKKKLPPDIKEPTIRRIDPSDQPILILALKADLTTAKLFDLANETVRPQLEQVSKVGLVEVIGGRKREVQLLLDRDKLKRFEVSASQVASRLGGAGENIPAGKIDLNKKELVFRTLGQFNSIKDIESTVVNFYGNEVPVTVRDVGTVVDSLTDERSKTYINGEKSLFLFAFRQSGANTLEVVEGLKSKIEKINAELKHLPGKGELAVVRDGGRWIRNNVEDVQDSILMGVILAVGVVFLFLANARSTLITGLALPNSLIGAFILMAAFGFTINIMTLLALSLSVGLLIDDAIVVRENIFRHIEMGRPPEVAARTGTKEVRLAVIATTLCVIAVFGPVGFLKGVVGQFFKQFGLTICFAMAISLFDALTIAPMLSAYFGGVTSRKYKHGLWQRSFGKVLDGFGRFQDWLQERYGEVLQYTLQKPLRVLAASFLIFLGSCAVVVKVPKTFLPTSDSGEFSLSIDLPPGTTLDAMNELATKVDTIVRSNAEVEKTALTVGGRDGASHIAESYVKLVDQKNRKLNTSQFKEKLRAQLKEFSFANPKVKDYDAIGGGHRPFSLNLIGFNQKELEAVAGQVVAKLKSHPGLKDVDTNYRAGKPEFQIIPDKKKMESLGVSTSLLGLELRAQLEGVLASKFREEGKEYDIRVRLNENERNLKNDFGKIFVPNLNHNLIRLTDIASSMEAEGPAKINRQDRARYIQVNADVAPGAGLGNIMDDVKKMFDTEIKLPPGMRYSYMGQTENFRELAENMVVALGFGILFIFMVLASLYESFITPFTIMLALPLALCGSFFALFITGQSLNIFSMIGTFMLLGVATKNSILLVDYANQLVAEGKDRSTALMIAGKTRLRPILMTTMALIAGTLPVALGLNEASRQRVGMGIAIIGGLISSTILTLLVVPAAYSYIDRFRVWSKAKMKKLVEVK